MNHCGDKFCTAGEITKKFNAIVTLSGSLIFCRMINPAALPCLDFSLKGSLFAVKSKHCFFSQNFCDHSAVPKKINSEIITEFIFLFKII